MTDEELRLRGLKDRRYIRVIHTCARGDACINHDRPGEHDTRAEAGVCVNWDWISKSAPTMNEEITLRGQLTRSLTSVKKGL